MKSSNRTFMAVVFDFVFSLIILVKMGRICVVEACGSEYYPDCGLSFHKFPKDPDVREKWISIIPMSSTRKLTDASVASEEMEQANLPLAIKLVKEMNINIQQVSQLVDNMLVRVKSGEMSTDKGLSFLEMKYQMLLSYLINLTYIVLRKCTGEKIESDPSIERLIEIRTVLEKIRPIDSKLKYQIDKLVKTAAVGAVDDDPQSYRPNPSNLVSKIDNSDEDSSDDSDDTQDKVKKANKSNIYVPPKFAAVHFDKNVSEDKDKSRNKLLNSSVIRELREEYSDAPLEISTGNHVKHSISKYEQEKTEYEENYLTRLPVTKEEKNRRRKLTTIGVLADEVTGRSTQKRKIKSKKGKGFKRRRTH